MDTGGSPPSIDLPSDTTGDIALPTGSQIEVSIGPTGNTLGEYDFAIGDTSLSGIDELEIEPETGIGWTNLGTALFFHCDAFFDQANGRVGVAPHG
jgi:hypothetical protein